MKESQIHSSELKKELTKKQKDHLVKAMIFIMMLGFCAFFLVPVAIFISSKGEGLKGFVIATNSLIIVTSIGFLYQVRKSLQACKAISKIIETKNQLETLS